MRYGSFSHQVVALYYLYDTCYLCILMAHVIFVPSWYMLSLYPYRNVSYLPCRFQIAYYLHCTCSFSFFIFCSFFLFSFFSLLFLLLLLVHEATSGMQQNIVKYTAILSFLFMCADMYYSPSLFQWHVCLE